MTVVDTWYLSISKIYIVRYDCCSVLIMYSDLTRLQAAVSFRSVPA